MSGGRALKSSTDPGSKTGKSVRSTSFDPEVKSSFGFSSPKAVGHSLSIAPCILSSIPPSFSVDVHTRTNRFHIYAVWCFKTTQLLKEIDTQAIQNKLVFVERRRKLPFALSANWTV